MSGCGSIASAKRLEHRLVDDSKLHVVSASVSAQHLTVDSTVLLRQLKWLMRYVSSRILSGLNHGWLDNATLVRPDCLEQFHVWHGPVCGLRSCRHEHMPIAWWHASNNLQRRSLIYLCKRIGNKETLIGRLFQLIELIFETCHHYFTWLCACVMLIRSELDGLLNLVCSVFLHYLIKQGRLRLVMMLITTKFAESTFLLILLHKFFVLLSLSLVELLQIVPGRL